MIECNFYQNQSVGSKYFGKWYPRNEPKGIVDLDGLAQHIAGHNTPFSKGVPRTQSAANGRGRPQFHGELSYWKMIYLLL